MPGTKLRTPWEGLSGRLGLSCWCAMLNIKKILLPVDFPNTSLRVIHQAATLAHHFHSEIVMLHVVTAQSHAAGVPEGRSELAGWDMLAEIIRESAEKPGPVAWAGA